jgi:hypothetical protein
MKITCLLTIALFLISCSSGSKENNPAKASSCLKANADQAPQLLWSTSGFEAPESVLLYENNSENEKPFYLVSNVSGNPSEKDGRGWISKLSVDGKIQVKKFSQGLNAPKGMAEIKGLVYVADIDRVVCFRISNGKKMCETNIPGAKFLNDINFIYGSAVIVSDTMTNKLSVVDQSKQKTWLDDAKLESPNGITRSHKGDSLLIASWGPGMKDDFSTTALGRILEINKDTRKITQWSSARLGNLDGIAVDGPDAVIVSDWMAGKVYRVKKNGECTTVLEGLKGAADFSFNNKSRTLVIPLMLENKVNAYKLPEYN